MKKTINICKMLVKNILKKMKSFLKPVSERLKSKAKRQRSLYTHYYKRKRIQKRTILYEAHFGRGLLCNAYAIFYGLIKKEEFKRFKHIWIISDFEDNKEIINEYKYVTNVKFIRRDSRKYLKYLCSAKYIINNSTLPGFFTKRKEQIYINTWHGIPLKKLGYDMFDGNIAVANTVRNFLSVDFLISPNKFMTNIFTESYKLNGIFQGKIIEEGYPRNDFIFHTDRDVILNKLMKFGVEVDENKKIILYAPTWRGEDFFNPNCDIDEYCMFIDKIYEKVSREEYQILVKPHQIVYKFIKDDKRVLGRFIPATIDTNQLLSVVDILVSDYSSIFFDFLVTGRPILFYIPDIEYYNNYRGLYFQISDLPGPSSKSLEKIADWIIDIGNVNKKYKEVYEKTKKWACEYDDGNVTEKVIDIVFKRKTQGYKVLSGFCKNEKKKILLFRGNMDENGITYSYMNLLRLINYDKYDITAVVIKKNNNQVIQKILDLDKNARTLTRVSTWNGTLLEEFRNEIILKYGMNNKLCKWIFPKKIYQREYRRCFGNCQFDYVIDFSGYSPFYNLLLLQAKNSKRLVWQHTDLDNDRKKVVNNVMVHKYTLGTVISLYPYYDKIVSCSKSVMKVNREKLSTDETFAKFTYAKNTIDFQRVLGGIKNDNVLKVNKKNYLIKEGVKIKDQYKEVTLLLAPIMKNINFVTMGRMSPEKNHISLINGFALLNKEYSNTHLYIIGEGPLKKSEYKLVKDLQLEESITFTGNLNNPFSLINLCDCFVLPSIHEGQPLTILEARALGIQIIVSNFSTVEDSLIKDGQYLIGTDINEIYKGLKAFILGRVPNYKFDYNKYNLEAYGEFSNLFDA
jgi:CDP-glycerol glycerophosphotransferase